MEEEIKVYIDPVIADGICRSALMKFAVARGLNDKKNFSCTNWFWYAKHQRRGVTFVGVKR